MPKLIIHSPVGTFNAADRQRVAGNLATLGLDCEALQPSPMVRSTVWTYFADYAADAVFMGDEPARLPVVTLQIYVLAGGLDAAGKRRLIDGATAILDRRPDGTAVAPVYVVIHEVAEQNWGIFGKQADLTALRASPPDAPAI
ncbi:Phenylpyruvate tautomerase PptA, 4-oxalocrotonate tautomerase family [Paracoccus aminovorans]|uniref:Phenylpyruvate tautomerase PptA, 4-oxalocrotonate tautomerase family n=1 Tax=Paracoccus aminovorans TaxID=34004 RepID=A0A1I3DJH5_9RHOB|nr:tautomerase family protein [Paracoccus aminovorans]CQR86967.1 4-oxalocrotonate tautomerase [Paracoccus aminovorans]SFH86894.1 Phenylpyruvate tautomerase PptA, 4-oxalocrotonate tautomerase family [Paracoccus aminovorans]